MHLPERKARGPDHFSYWTRSESPLSDEVWVDGNRHSLRGFRLEPFNPALRKRDRETLTDICRDMGFRQPSWRTGLIDDDRFGLLALSHCVNFRVRSMKRLLDERRLTGYFDRSRITAREMYRAARCSAQYPLRR